MDEVKFHDKKAESVVGAGRVSGNVLRVNLVDREPSWHHQDLRLLLCTFLLACPCVDKDPQLSVLAPGRFPLSIPAPGRFSLHTCSSCSCSRRSASPALMWDEPDLRRVMAIVGLTFVLSDMPLELIILLLVSLLCIWGN